MPLSGTVQTIKDYHRSVSGELSGTGSLGSSTSIEKIVQGTLTFLGSVGECTSFKIITSGILGFIGTLDSFAGKVATFGSFGKWISHLSYTKNGISIGRKFFQLTKSLLITRWRNR